MQIKRLYLLLTVNESAMDIPVNLEARRRISFFSTSLFMDMPPAPKVRSMIPFRLVAGLSSVIPSMFFSLEANSVSSVAQDTV